MLQNCFRSNFFTPLSQPTDSA